MWNSRKEKYDVYKKILNTDPNNAKYQRAFNSVIPCRPKSYDSTCHICPKKSDPKIKRKVRCKDCPVVR